MAATPEGTRYLPADEINRDNVARMEVASTYHGETDPAFATRTGEFISSTPLAGLLPTIPAVRDEALRRRLWEATESLLGDRGLS